MRHSTEKLFSMNRSNFAGLSSAPPVVFPYLWLAMALESVWDFCLWVSQDRITVSWVVCLHSGRPQFSRLCQPQIEMVRDLFITRMTSLLTLCLIWSSTFRPRDL